MRESAIISSIGFLHNAMISYDGVIRKRLRIKGQPEIPPYEEEETPTTIPVSADVPSAPQRSEGPADGSSSAFDVDEAQYDDVDEVEPVGGDITDVIGGQKVLDKRTEAQKQHDEVMERREKELLRKDASKSYKEQVEVSFRPLNAAARVNNPPSIEFTDPAFVMFCVSRQMYFHRNRNSTRS